MKIHHLDWFERESVLVGYIKRESSADAYSIYGSSLGLLKIEGCDRDDFTGASFGSFEDMNDQVCSLPPTEEADEMSVKQRYMTRFIKEW